MATPVGHAIAGYAVYSFVRSPARSARLGLMLLVTFAAIAPDLDVIPGLLVGRPAQYHGGISHSLGMAVAAGLVLAALFRGRGVPFVTVFLLTLVAYSSHLALDMLGPDARRPIGIPVLWPISGSYFISPISVLPGVHHAVSTSTATSDWIRALLSLPNVAAMVFEVALVTPVILVGRLLRGRSAKAERAQVEAERI